jgi:hypothetical protein
MAYSNVIVKIRVDLLDLRNATLPYAIGHKPNKDL